MSFLYLLGDSEQDSTSTKEGSKPWRIACQQLKIFNTIFNYHDKNRPQKEQGIDYSDLALATLI